MSPLLPHTNQYTGHPTTRIHRFELQPHVMFGLNLNLAFMREDQEPEMMDQIAGSQAMEHPSSPSAMFCLPHPADSLLANRLKSIDRAQKHCRQLPVSSMFRGAAIPLRTVTSESLLQSCNHDLVVLVKRRGRLVFMDQMLKMAEVWRRILCGEAFMRVAHHDVLAGDKLQTAAAHACLFGEFFLPKLEPAVQEHVAFEEVLRESCLVLMYHFFLFIVTCYGSILGRLF